MSFLSVSLFSESIVHQRSSLVLICVSNKQENVPASKTWGAI